MDDTDGEMKPVAVLAAGEQTEMLAFTLIGPADAVREIVAELRSREIFDWAE